MIRLKHLLFEQSGFNAARIAKQIYDSKGYVWDDERGAIQIIKQNIKDLKQYTAVTKQIQKLAGSGLGQFLHSFMNPNDLIEVGKYLIKILPSSSWGWTVKQVITWEDVIAEVSARRRGVAFGSERRPSEYQTVKEIFDEWEKNPESKKTDILYKLLTDPNLYGSKLDVLVRDFQRHETHAGLEASAFLTSFIPIAGPYLAAGIMSADAAVYADEGDPLSASLSIAFAALPFIGKYISKIPAVKSFNEATLAKLGQKLGKFKSVRATKSIANISKTELATLEPEEFKLVMQVKSNYKTIFDFMNERFSVWKQILKDPELVAMKKSMDPAEWKALHSGIMSGKYAYEDIKKIAKSRGLYKGLGVNVGIKFAPAELQQLNSITTDIVQQANKGTMGKEAIYKNTYYIRNAVTRNDEDALSTIVKNSSKNIRQKHTKNVFDKPVNVIRDVPVRFVTKQEALAHDITANAGAGWDGTIYMVLDDFIDEAGQVNKERIRTTITHELAHLKDPSLKRSPKLASTYNSRAGEVWTDIPDKLNPKQNWFKNYYLHDWERNAINPQVYEQLANGTQELLKKAGKNKTLQTLDVVLNFLKNPTTSNWTDDAARLVYGDHANKFRGVYGEISTFFTELSNRKPEAYKKLITDMTKQITTLKGEISKLPSKMPVVKK